VEAPVVVPLIMTVTPGMGAPSSPFTVPLTFFCCANAATPSINAQHKNIAFSEKDLVITIKNSLCVKWDNLSILQLKIGDLR
jgi:hypothetical protein